VNTVPPGRGRVAVVGAGTAGMATALSVHQAGHDMTLLERYPQARPAGNILNLWPPPVRALGLLGVDIEDLGAPCYSEFRSVAGRVRVRVNLSDDVLAKYGGGFIGLPRPRPSRRHFEVHRRWRVVTLRFPNWPRGPG
jgi:2-polyprenyl-6-methoxyphenol hydroxylase-like FAD-dependent oxidoreductase